MGVWKSATEKASKYLGKVSRAMRSGASRVFRSSEKNIAKAEAERTTMGVERLKREAEEANRRLQDARTKEMFRKLDKEIAGGEQQAASKVRSSGHKSWVNRFFGRRSGVEAEEKGASKAAREGRHTTSERPKKASEGTHKTNTQPNEENVVDGQFMKEDNGIKKGPNGPDGPKGPNGPKHQFAKDFAWAAGRSGKEFAMKHPGMALLLAGIGYQMYQGPKDGLGLVQRLQGIALGPQYSKDGQHQVGANGVFSILNGLCNGTTNMQSGEGLYDGIMNNGLGVQRAKKVNLAIDRISNEGWYLVGKGNKLIDSTGKVCGEVVGGTKDLIGKVVNGAGDVVGQLNPSTGQIETYDTGASQSQDGSYMGTSTRQQQLSQAMGPAELAGGIMTGLLGRSWMLKALGALTAYNGYQNMRQNTPQMENSIRQSYGPSQSQPQERVTYEQEPSNEVIVNTGRQV